ncbi:MAG: polysaccharide deacetylase family protein [Pigmentiphaga sp.]|nr:polysaccharide deacetylase family protein [Pigmentiphaga sp.]
MAASCLPVLMYHHVSPHVGSLTVSPANFAAQLDWLARAGYTPLGAAGLADFFAGRPVPRKPVVLTFDDGYLDNFVYAHPELVRHGMTAMLFAVTGWMGEGPPRPHAGQGGALPQTFGHREAKARLEAGDTDAVMARWSELRQMREAGSFEIHSHTHTHTRWDLRLDDPAARRAALADDLARSRTALAQRLNVNSDHLCWPQGYYDDDYLDVACALGFSHLHTTKARELNRPGQDTRHIYRVAVKNRRGFAFAQRVWLAGHPRWGALYNRWKR